MGVDILVWVMAVVLIGIGLGGLVLPALPGPPILFAGLVTAAWAEDFAYVGWGTLSVLGGMAVLMYLLDFAATAFGVERFGASGRAIVGATLGGVVGLFLGLPGVVVGPFLGAVVGELTVRGNLQAAGRAGVGATLGLALGIAAKMALAISMLGIFLVVRLWA